MKTCREVMTASPSVCLPTDSVTRAAQLMRDEDIGPVLIVDSNENRRLVGIVTDRDLTLNVIAVNRNAGDVLLSEVMTSDPVSCREDEDVQRALDAMSEFQVRRIPVVDAQQRLVGIISQADVARKLDEEDVGEVVEDISAPSYGSYSTRTSRSTSRGYSSYPDEGGSRSSDSAFDGILTALLWAGVGAGLMFLLEPGKGRARRTAIKDKATSAGRATGDFVSSTSRNLRNKVQGIQATTRLPFSKSEPVSDETLVARVRSKMGHVVSHPHAIHVEARDGQVTLRGHVMSAESDKLVKTVSGVEGVRGVDNQVESHADATGIPSLQGGTTSQESTLSL